MRKNDNYRDALREQIIITAGQLFRTNGIRGVKMDDIADHPSCSKRTLYELFADKEQLVIEVLEYNREATNRHLIEFMEAGNSVMALILESFRIQIENFRTTNPSFYTDVHKYRKVQEHLKRHKKAGHNEVLAIFEKGVEQGFFRTDINYDIMVEVFTNRGQNVMDNSFFKRYSLAEVFRNSIIIDLRGICTAKGLVELEAFLKKYEEFSPETSDSASEEA